MSELMQDGVRLMLAGMGVVFSLLGVMVLAVKAMSGLAGALAPPLPVAEVSVGGAGNVGRDTEVVAVVTAAIQAHRVSGRK